MQVFSSSFAAVWPLDDPLATATVADATGQHAGTPGGLGPSDQVPAQLGGGVDFDGTGNQRINFTLPLTGGGDHTISAWVNQRAAVGCDMIIVMGNPNIERSAGWIATEYANQSSPQTFYAVGAEEPVR